MICRCKSTWTYTLVFHVILPPSPHNMVCLDPGPGHTVPPLGYSRLLAFHICLYSRTSSNSWQIQCNSTALAKTTTPSTSIPTNPHIDIDVYLNCMLSLFNEYIGRPSLVGMRWRRVRASVSESRCTHLRCATRLARDDCRGLSDVDFNRFQTISNDFKRFQLGLNSISAFSR